MICLAGFRKRSEIERARVNGCSPLPCLPRLTRLTKKIRVLRHAALRRYLYVYYRTRQLRDNYNLWSKKKRQAHWRVTKVRFVDMCRIHNFVIMLKCQLAAIMKRKSLVKRRRAERKRAHRPCYSPQEDSVPSPPSPPPTSPEPRYVGYEWADKYLSEREGSKKVEIKESRPIRSDKPRMCSECQKCFGRRTPSKRLLMLRRKEITKERYERRKYMLWRAGFRKRSNTERARVNGRSPLPCLPRFTRLARKIRTLQHAALKRYLYVRFRLHTLRLCHMLWSLRDFFAYIHVTEERVADMFRLQRFINILKGHLDIQKRKKRAVQRQRARRNRTRRSRFPSIHSTDEDSFYSPPSSPFHVGYERDDECLRESGGGNVVDYSGRQPFNFDCLQKWCYCREPMIDNMIGCDNVKCKIVWFHATCVGLFDIPKGKWYCPSCARELRSLPPLERWDDVELD